MADALQISGLLGHNTQPNAHGALDRREADEAVVRNHPQDGHKGLGGAAIGVFADGLAQTLLQFGGQQQLAHQLVEIGAVGFHHATNEPHGHPSHAVLLGKNAGNGLGQSGIPVIQGICDLPFVVARGTPSHFIQIGGHVLGNIAVQHGQRSNIGQPLHGKPRSIFRTASA